MMRKAQRGFTLAEAMITVTVAGILLAIAVPSMLGTMAKRRLDGAANLLANDLQYARTQAVSDNVQVTFATTSTSAYSITGNQTYKAATMPTGVTVDNGKTVIFQPLRGCLGTDVSYSSGVATAGTAANCSASNVSINLTNGTDTLRVVVNNMGRVQLCSPTGSSGYSSC
jgi:type IV fimbrial biogenesis protein FimT